MAVKRGTEPAPWTLLFSESISYFDARPTMMKPTCFTPSGNSIPWVVGGLTTIMRSLGATRPPVVLYQDRPCHPNDLSTATKKPFTMRLAMVLSESLSRSASLTCTFSPGACSYQGRAVFSAEGTGSSVVAEPDGLGRPPPIPA